MKFLLAISLLTTGCTSAQKCVSNGGVWFEITTKDQTVTKCVPVEVRFGK